MPPLQLASLRALITRGSRPSRSVLAHPLNIIMCLPPRPACLVQDKAKRSMAAATAISSFVACFLMGILGNLPFALAPGMGINAFFTYTVVGFSGSGMVRRAPRGLQRRLARAPVVVAPAGSLGGGVGVRACRLVQAGRELHPPPTSLPLPLPRGPPNPLLAVQITYQQALAAAFIEGWIFFAISISGLRAKIVQALPKAIMLSTAGGIGLFLSFIGLQVRGCTGQV